MRSVSIEGKRNTVTFDREALIDSVQMWASNCSHLRDNEYAVGCTFKSASSEALFLWRRATGLPPPTTRLAFDPRFHNAEGGRDNGQQSGDVVQEDFRQDRLRALKKHVVVCLESTRRWEQSRNESSILFHAGVVKVAEAGENLTHC